MYPSDLNDKQWERIEVFFERSDPRGSKGIHEKRIVVNAILYVTKSGCQWRMLPKDFPPHGTVYDHFRNWSRRGIWEKVLDELNKEARKSSGRAANPSYGIIDSQSVKTQYASDERGFHGGKKVTVTL
jgi:putative transposase